jgi:hypothetical protein
MLRGAKGFQYDRTATAMRLQSNARRLMSDCKAIAKVIAKAIAKRAQSDCKAVAKRLISDCKAIAKRLIIDCKAIAKGC